MKKEPKIGLFSFFSGAGLLDLGFEKTDFFNIVFVNEAYSPFIHIYKESRNLMGLQPPEYGYQKADISDFLNGEKAKYLNKCVTETKSSNDLIGFIGGPPCPDFSVGGKNRGIKGENGKLSGTYVQLIMKNTPDFFLFENVKGLYRTKKHREFFDLIKHKLTRSGYYITEKLINAIEYGVPQDRERIILVGFHKKCLNKFRVSVNGESALTSFDWEHKTKFSASEIFSLNWPKTESFFEDSQKKCPQNVNRELTVKHWFDKNNVESHPNSNHCFQPRAGLSKFQTIDEGDDLKKSYKRLHRWRYSPTAAYGNNEVHLHPYKPRRISVAEALAIQSVPKNFIMPSDASLTNMFKTIGNGVPYLASKGIAETIQDYVAALINGEITNA